MRRDIFIIQDHKVGQLISDDVVTIAQQAIGEKDEEMIELDSKLYFVSQLMYPCFEIQNKFDDFRHAYLLLSKYPIGKIYREKFTREDYIIYNLEFYMISQVALLDRLLHLVNFVYEIGLDDPNVKHSLIVRNNRVPASVKRVLRRFDNFLNLNQKRKLQNRIKHKERLKDKMLYKPSLLEWSSKTEIDALSARERHEMKKAALGLYKVYISIRRSLIKEEIKKMKKMTENLLDLMYPTILKKYNSY